MSSASEQASFTFTPELRERIAENLASLPPTVLAAGDLRHAAVGVVLLPDEQGQACFVLTRRLDTLRRHSGQWALPGGRIEPGESPQTAALREIHEEVGLDLLPGAVLGRLDDFVSRSGHLISAFVVWAGDHRESLVLSPEEVAAAYRVPLQALDQPRAIQLQPLLHIVFATLNTQVYAPTAAILYQFREAALHRQRVRVADFEQPPFAWQ
jgi:8-oxo-dGTP pyrophosphatase MutT (NUDIX family)